MIKHAINWFEIPVLDFDRALKFYEGLSGEKMQVMETEEMKSAFFNFDMQLGAIGGCIMHGKGYEPSKTGSMIYLNGGDDLSIPLSKVVELGGKIIVPKVPIGKNGHMAQFEDTEGNRVGLHTRK
jgi:predicted enzyme related to lactoylglutathione lyase